MSTPREVIREARDAFLKQLQAMPLAEDKKTYIRDLLMQGGERMQGEVDSLVTSADATLLAQTRFLARSGDTAETIVEGLSLAVALNAPYEALGSTWQAFVDVCGGNPRSVRGMLNGHRLYDYVSVSQTA